MSQEPQTVDISQKIQNYDDALNFLVEKAYDGRYSAAPLRHYREYKDRTHSSKPKPQTELEQQRLDDKEYIKEVIIDYKAKIASEYKGEKFRPEAPLNRLKDFFNNTSDSNFNDEFNKISLETSLQIVQALKESYKPISEYKPSIANKIVDGSLIKESSIMQVGKAGIALTGLIVYGAVAAAKIATRASLFLAGAIPYYAFSVLKDIGHSVLKKQAFYKYLPDLSESKTLNSIPRDVAKVLTRKTLYTLPIAEKIVNIFLHPIDSWRGLQLREKFSQKSKLKLDENLKSEAQPPINQEPKKQELGQGARKLLSLESMFSKKSPAQSSQDDELLRQLEQDEFQKEISKIASEFRIKAHSTKLVKDTIGIFNNQDLLLLIDKLSEEKLTEFMQKHYSDINKEYISRNKKILEKLVEEVKNEDLCDFINNKYPGGLPNNFEGLNSLQKTDRLMELTKGDDPKTVGLALAKHVETKGLRDLANLAEKEDLLNIIKLLDPTKLGSTTLDNADKLKLTETIIKVSEEKGSNYVINNFSKYFKNEDLFEFIKKEYPTSYDENFHVHAKTSKFPEGIKAYLIRTINEAANTNGESFEHIERFITIKREATSEVKDQKDAIKTELERLSIATLKQEIIKDEFKTSTFNQLNQIIKEQTSEDVLLNLKIYAENKELEESINITKERYLLEFYSMYFSKDSQNLNKSKISKELIADGLHYEDSGDITKKLREFVESKIKKESDELRTLIRTTEDKYLQDFIKEKYSTKFPNLNDNLNKEKLTGILFEIADKNPKELADSLNIYVSDNPFKKRAKSFPIQTVLSDNSADSLLGELIAPSTSPSQSKLLGIGPRSL